MEILELLTVEWTRLVMLTVGIFWAGMASPRIVLHPRRQLALFSLWGMAAASALWG